ncbi:MAG: hypothetical protein EBR82_11245 [Caulobacteraceae bacterium]|nr:hypothetical protein [Caulobacteraceae bacterium]
MPASENYKGSQQLTSATDTTNALNFMIRMIMGQMATATVVKVLAVSNAGGVSAVGTVDVLPLVAQIDGAGKATPHAPIYGLPYMRLQGGADAVILDPKVDDIGLAVFASRDISAVKATKAAANPGSFRQFSLSDGLYIGGFLNGVPTQYVRFSTTGVEIVTPGVVNVQAGGTVTITSPNMRLVGPVHVTGALTGDSTAAFTGAVSGDGRSLTTHKHTGVTVGGGNTGGSIP